MSLDSGLASGRTSAIVMPVSTAEDHVLVGKAMIEGGRSTGQPEEVVRAAFNRTPHQALQGATACAVAAAAFRGLKKLSPELRARFLTNFPP